MLIINNDLYLELFCILAGKTLMRTQNRFLKVEKNLLPFLNSDSPVVYILNGGILKENFEGDLSLVDNKSLIELTVIDAEKLKKDFGIDQKFGVLIKANVKEKKDAKISIPT